jgi:hypothetical protein
MLTGFPRSRRPVTHSERARSVQRCGPVHRRRQSVGAQQRRARLDRGPCQSWKHQRVHVLHQREQAGVGAQTHPGRPVLHPRQSWWSPPLIPCCTSIRDHLDRPVRHGQARDPVTRVVDQPPPARRSWSTYSVGRRKRGQAKLSRVPRLSRQACPGAGIWRVGEPMSCGAPTALASRITP